MEVLDGMLRDAQISSDGLYRYSLTRHWGTPNESSDPLVFLMLNPSTADGLRDDPTIRRCIGFAKREENNGILVVNLFAYRTPSPKKLRDAFESGVDVVGPENKSAITEAIRHTGRVVCAWGATPIIEGMDWLGVEDLWAMGAQTYHLGRTKTGQPRHPLYVRADQPLVEYKKR